MLRMPYPFQAAPRACVLAAAMLCSAGAQAVTVLDTYGPGTTANGSRWSLYNELEAIDPAARTAQNLAVAFSLASATTIDSVLSSIKGTGTVNLQILTDVASSPSGAVLFATSLVNPTENGLVSGIGLNLAAGNYWLTARTSAGFQGEWQGGPSASSTVWAWTSGADTSTWLVTNSDDAPAVRISAVPEPASWLLMLGGASLIGLQLRRRAA